MVGHRLYHNETKTHMLALCKPAQFMKLKDYHEMEKQVLDELLARSKSDNEAAKILLNHINDAKRALGEWQRNKDSNANLHRNSTRLQDSN